jgi:hypothetical protein
MLALMRLRPSSHRMVLRLPSAGLGELRKRTQIDDLRCFIRDWMIHAASSFRGRAAADRLSQIGDYRSR